MYSRIILPFIVISMTIYLLFIGATRNGMVSARVQLMTLAVGTLLTAGWLFFRARQKWKWHQTPLDWVIPLWIIALAVSLFANWDERRLFMLAVWYIGLYIALWYALYDLIANGKLQRQTLIDGLLAAGALVVLLSLTQLFVNDAPFGRSFFGLPRVSVLGNPNYASGFLVVLIPPILGRLIGATRFRLVWVIYVLAAITALFFSYSRGGWLAFAASLAMVIVLTLAHKGLLSTVNLRRWFMAQRRGLQIAAVTVALGLLTGGIATGIILLTSLNESGRSLELRTYHYEVAGEMFLEKPLTGHGLYTYGKGLQQAIIEHPDYSPTQHIHAHNLIFNVAAELGIMGLAALFATAMATLLGIYRNWQTGQQRAMLIGAAGAVTAVMIHHLLDVTTLLVSIALMSLIAWIAAAAPFVPVPAHPRRGWLITGLWVLLGASAFWSVNLNRQYTDITSQGIREEDFAAAAVALQPVIDADPLMVPYRLQQAYFYSLAANEGNTGALQAAIEEYRHITTLMPHTITGWVNLGALLKQSGQLEEAAQMMERAAAIDYRTWQFFLLWAQYAEAIGDEEAAREAYTLLLEKPHLALLPVLQESALARELIAGVQLEMLDEVVLLYNDGQYEEAARLWDEDPQETTAGHVVRALLALELEGQEAAQVWLDKAMPEILTPEYSMWLELGERKLNGVDNAEILGELTPDIFGTDYRFASGPVSFYHRVTTGRIFIPQVGFTPINPLILRLLTQTSQGEE